jgi:murein DD-endopeptidase MepM/ murein hydrolase activator NlpD
MASTSLGTLTLDLAVRLSEFTDGLSRAERETRDRTQEMSDSVGKFKEKLIDDLSGTAIGDAVGSLNEKLSSITEAFGESGLAGAAAIGAVSVVGSVAAIGAGLVTLALQTAEADEQLVRLATRANTSTKNLQVLTAATAAYGLEMEGVGDILADAQEKLGEFSATGGGGLVDTLELMQNATKKTDAELEIFGRSLSTMDSVDAIQAVVDEMEKADATTQEVRFVTESLASGLGDIIPLWDNNGEALRNYEHDLNEAGVIRTKESIEQSQLLANELEGLQIKIEGVSNQIVTKSLPAMIGLIDYMKTGTTDADGLSDSLSSMGLAAAVIATPFIGLMSVFKQVGTVVAGLMGSISSLFSLMSNVLSNPFKIGTYLEEYARSKGLMRQYMMEDIKAEKDRAISSLQTIWSSPRELANKGAGFSALVPGASIATYGAGSVTEEIIASRAIADAEEEEAKAKEKTAKANDKKTAALNRQAEAQARLVGISGDTGIGSAHLHIQYRDKSRAVSQSDMDRFRAGGKKITDYRKTSDFGPRNTGIKGASTNHRGTDFAIPKNTPITTNVAVKGVKTWKDSKGGGYVSTITFEDGVVIDLLHQMPGVMGVEKGATTGNSAVDSATSKAQAIAQKAMSDAEREREKAAAEEKRVLEELERAKLSITQKYATYKEKIESEHTNNVIEIERLYAEGSGDRAKYLAREEERYAIEKNAGLLSVSEKYFSEEQRIHESHRKAMKVIEETYIEDDSVRKYFIDAQKAAYEEDLANFKFTAEAKARAQYKMYKSIADSARAGSANALSTGKDNMMQRTLSDEEYQQWRLNQDYVEGFTSINNDFKNREAEINAVDERGNEAFPELERFELLEIAKQEHLDKMWALEQEYALKDQTLAEQQALQRIAMYQSLFSGIAGLTKSFAGEQSTAYRIMFGIEQGFAIAQAAMAIQQSIAKAMNLGYPQNIPVIAETVGQGAQIVSNIKNITMGGIAHGGLDYVPKEATYLLDEGERVLSPRQNKDLANFMSNSQRTTTSDVNINVTVDAKGNSTISGDNEKMGRDMANGIKAVVMDVMRKEKRQGGMLYGS